jgi:hypothetical protein
VVCAIFSFFPAIWDHGKTWKEVRSSKGNRRLQKQFKLFVLWALPVSGMAGTIFLGVEGTQDDKKFSGLESKYEYATNDSALTHKELTTTKAQLAGLQKKEEETSAFVNQSNSTERLNEEKNTVAAAQNILANPNFEALKTISPDRTITEIDQARFIRLMEGAPRGPVVVNFCMNAGAEAQNYATEIGQMIKAAGYNTGGFALFSGGKIPKGVAIAVRNATNQPPFAARLKYALEIIGIDTDGIIDPSTDENTVEIRVGAKP